ncbi:MAG: sugar ABC transporter substrate-binding protein [Candidatus Nanopelagicus sp.]|nr:sugar ABC transporter substrate-binding protein [Candidatus Nanopelagicus sp.]
MAKLKRAQGIALVCVLALGLSACSSSGNDSSEELSGELNLFLIPSPSSTSIQSFIPEFEEKTGVKVNVSETPYGEAHQKQLLSYKQKSGAYDIAQFDNSFLAPFCQAKAMTDLGEWVSGSDEYDINDFDKGQQDYGKCASGETFGLTLSTEPMIQWYRTDLYEKLGIKPATTWDEWYSNAQKIQASGANGQLIGFGPNVSWWWMTMVWSFGGKLYDENLNPTVNSPEAIAAVDYMKKLLSVSPKGAITANGDEVTSKFLGENIGAMLNYSGYYGMALDPSINKNAGKFATAPMPKGASDITHLAGWNIGIPSDAKNPNAAWAFLEFVLGKTNAKAYLESGAAAIGRKSIISDSSLLEKNPYLPQLEIPASSRIERYPQIAVWPEFEVAAIDAVTKVLTGKSASKAAMDALNEKLKTILANEPK